MSKALEKWEYRTFIGFLHLAQAAKAASPADTTLLDALGHSVAWEEQALPMLGQDGWELVSVVPLGDTQDKTNARSKWYFKRSLGVDP